MFTGIIEATAEVATVDRRDADIRITLAIEGTGFTDLTPGKSIAINGVCLTVVAIEDARRLSFDISGETLACTTFSSLQRHQRVNLERALALSSRLDGHLVSGHIDGIAEIRAISDQGDCRRLRVRPPAGLLQYIVRKGSVCIDGVSLTVNEVGGDHFDMNIIPHTLRNTIISEYQPGGRVNVEVDLIARYLQGLLRGRQTENQG